jgi:peptide deformylase
MAVLQLSVYPDPVLRLKAKRVKKVDRSILKLVDDMVETMYATSGVGLAAPQVGVSLRVAVIELPGEETVVLVNPEIVKRSGEIDVTEGCLSVPGYRGDIKRPEKVTVKALDRNGKEFRIKGEGLMAEALEHEIDHLNGTLYIDHLDSVDDLEKVAPDAETPEI